MLGRVCAPLEAEGGGRAGVCVVARGGLILQVWMDESGRYSRGLCLSIGIDYDIPCVCWLLRYATMAMRATIGLSPSRGMSIVVSREKFVERFKKDPHDDRVMIDMMWKKLIACVFLS